MNRFELKRRLGEAVIEFMLDRGLSREDVAKSVLRVIDNPKLSPVLQQIGAIRQGAIYGYGRPVGNPGYTDPIDDRNLVRTSIILYAMGIHPDHPIIGMVMHLDPRIVYPPTSASGIKVSEVDALGLEAKVESK